MMYAYLSDELILFNPHIFMLRVHMLMKNNVQHYREVNRTFYVLACNFSRPLRDTLSGLWGQIGRLTGSRN